MSFRVKSLSSLFNPIAITSVFIFYIFIYSPQQLDIESSSFIVIPYVLYIIYSLVLAKVYRPIAVGLTFFDSQYKFAQMLILLCCITNILCIISIIKIYGSLQTAVSWAGATEFTQKAQENANSTTQFLFIINFFTPPALVILANKFRRSNLGLILIFLAIQIILSIIFGTRIIFITSLSVLAIALSFKIKLNLKSLFSILIFIIFVVVSLIAIQSRRAGGDYASGVDEISNYYSISLDNGLRAIQLGQNSQPLFWTLRPILAFPVLPKASGILGVYEEAFGAIQIQDRQDDFDYAKNLGVNPSYNTFSSFGYAFLDAGWSGIFLILLSWLTIQVMFVKSMQNHLFSLLMFPVLYTASIDQLRTYWFFTDRNFYALICALFIIILPKILNKTTSFKLRGRYVEA